MIIVKRELFLISFVWSYSSPIYAGRGGTESFTIGLIRELRQRGIDSRVITYGKLGKRDGREFYDDIEFLDISKLDELSMLDDTIVYINRPFEVKTKKPPFVFLHLVSPDKRLTSGKPNLDNRQITLITNSQYCRSTWSEYLHINPDRIHIVYPFADPAFAKIKRPEKKTENINVLFAGRLDPNKGIFLFLEAIHQKFLSQGFNFYVTTAGTETKIEKMIEAMIRHSPMLTVVPARTTPQAMAELYANSDIVVLPSSSNRYWHEPFGMISVEAQHAGCRVIATGADGLIETNCGELAFFKPDDASELVQAIINAKNIGPVSAESRAESIKHFTRSSSADMFLRAISYSL